MPKPLKYFFIKITILFLILGISLFSCTVPPTSNPMLTQTSTSECIVVPIPSYGPEIQKFFDNKKMEFEEKKKTKIPYTGEISIKVNTGSKVFVYNPNDLNELNNLGKNEVPDSQNIAEITVNGTETLKYESQHTLKYESEHLEVQFKNTCNLDTFKSLYFASVEQSSDNFNLLKFDTKKIPLGTNYKTLVSEYNKGLAEDMQSIEFSSVSGMKTFFIKLDILINHLDLVNSLEFNTIADPL